MTEEEKPPLVVSPVVNASTAPTGTGSLGLAFLAGAAVALVGGLLWAGVVIVTRFDIGILALVVGAVTGVTVQRVAGGPVGGFERALAGVFAAGGVIIGKYVIFVHDVRATVGTLLAQHGISDGYLSGHQMSFFMHNFGTIVRPIYYLWIAFAFFAAFRTAGGNAFLGMGRRRP